MTRKKSTDDVKEDPIFIGIRDPSNLRRNMLEASRNFLKVLKRMEEIKILRSKKSEKLDEVQKNFRELKVLFSKLKKRVPASVITHTTSNKLTGMQKNKSKSPTLKVEVPKRAPSEIEKLEREISEIEKKLLNI